MGEDSHGEGQWSIPPGLTPEQRLDWEQARTIDRMASAMNEVARRLEALEKLVERVVKPIVDESIAWMATRRKIVESVWDSSVGPMKAGPTLIFIITMAIVAVAADQAGVDPIRLSGEARSWWNGECVVPLEDLDP